MYPSELGIPGKFKSYRPSQLEAIDFFNDNDRRFTVMAIPTGIGKGLIAVSLGLLGSGRTAILTSTKGLQDQYADDFYMEEDRIAAVQAAITGSGKWNGRVVADLRGKANYQCEDWPRLNCLEGLEQGCDCKCYEEAYGQAMRSKVVVTSYSKWIVDGIWNRVKRADLLILDEAHLAFEELARAMNFSLGPGDKLPLLGVDATLPDWKDWAGTQVDLVRYEHNKAQTKLSLGGRNLKEVLRLKDLLQKLIRLRDLEETKDWLVEKRQVGSTARFEFDCVWPGRYAESWLFGGVERVVLISATVRPRTMALLGVAKQHYSFKEWKREFPANRCQVYHIPTARLSNDNWDRDKRLWVETIDRIISSRLDRKGLVHTGSYDRQKYLMEHSSHKRIMLANDSSTTMRVVAEFRASQSPSVLVGPSFGTGWDFPYGQCEYQIISKIPFPDTSSFLAQKRKERDKSYGLFVAAQELVQRCGRNMRAADDRGETFLIDDQLDWFLPAVKGMVPSWFAVKRMGAIPAAPPKLEK